MGLGESVAEEIPANLSVLGNSRILSSGKRPFTCQGEKGYQSILSEGNYRNSTYVRIETFISEEVKRRGNCSKVNKLISVININSKVKVKC